MASQVAEQTGVCPNGHVQDPGQLAVDVAGGGRELGLPGSAVRNHAYVVRGLGYVPESRLATGRFGRMFRSIAPCIPDDKRIEEITKRMSEPSGEQLDGDTPAGYTYLGQFVDHDITFDPTSSLDRQNDPDALTNFRTPRFDLDCVYGRGPADQPYLYEKPAVTSPPHFAIGGDQHQKDLPRSRGIALIGDPRNDENVIISQLHLTFMLFHNKVCDWLTADGESEYRRHRRGTEEVFDCAQRLVRWHYQWIVVHDFLPRFLARETFEDILHSEPLAPRGPEAERIRLRFFSWQHQIFMPVEFAAAAYRFGHSVIRGRYALNGEIRKPLFKKDSTDHLGGFRPLPQGWQIEWDRFFPVPGGSGADVQKIRKIDRYLVKALEEMPPELAGGESILARRNLLRGARLGLPSGQDVAAAMGLTPLTDEQLDLPDQGPAPLWYYVLREAELLGNGQHLGPVGSRIVGEVFFGMLMADPSSYFSNAPAWKPVLPGRTATDFTMGDLIAFTGFGVTP